MSSPSVCVTCQEYLLKQMKEHQIIRSMDFLTLHGSELVVFRWKSDWQIGLLLDALCVRLKIF